MVIEWAVGTIWQRGFSSYLEILFFFKQDVFPRLGIKLGSPALGAQSLSYWTSREIPLGDTDSRCVVSMIAYTLSWDSGQALKMIDESLWCPLGLVVSKGENLNSGPKTISVTQSFV